MPDQLVTVDDGQGRQYLATTSDGRGLLLQSDCEACCGGGTPVCPVIRRWDRCVPQGEQGRCVAGPDHLWLCDDFLSPGLGSCGGETLRDFLFHKFNACYKASSTVLPTAELPPGDVLETPTCGDWVNATTCAEGTAPLPGLPGRSLCTDCDLFYIAQPCPGSTGATPCAIGVTAVPSGASCAGFCLSGVGRVIDTSQTYTLAEITNLGIPPCSGNPTIQTDFKCCECVPGCNSTPAPATWDNCLNSFADWTGSPRCCCSCDNTFVGSMTFQRTYVIGNPDNCPNPGVGYGTLTESASLNWNYRRRCDGSVTGNAPPLSIPITVTIRCANGTISDVSQFQSESWPFIEGCPQATLPTFPRFGLRCPSRVPQDSFWTVFATADANCHSNSLFYNDSYNDGSPFTIQAMFSWQSGVIPNGQCTGGCGGGGGLPLAVQRARSSTQSMGLAMLAAMARPFRAETDKGLGDTIERIANKLGGKWLADKFRAATGKECGCTGRKARLNAIHPYG